MLLFAICRRDSSSRALDQVAGVEPHLVRVVDPHADQFEVGGIDHRTQEPGARSYPSPTARPASIVATSAGDRAHSATGGR